LDEEDEEHTEEDTEMNALEIDDGSEE